MLCDGRQERGCDLVEGQCVHLAVYSARANRERTRIAHHELRLDRLCESTIHEDMKDLHRLGVEPPSATDAARLDLLIVKPLEMVWPEILEQEVPAGCFEMSTDKGLVGI